MKLILMRHGQSGGNVGLKGKDEFDSLTLRGVKQAEEAGGKLKERKIRAIYCSMAKRCEQTLDEVLRQKNEVIPIHISRLLGPKTKKEKWENLQKRVQLFLADLECEADENDEILIISHLPVVKMFEYQIEGKIDFLENGGIREYEVKKKKIVTPSGESFQATPEE